MYSVIIPLFICTSGLRVGFGSGLGPKHEISRAGRAHVEVGPKKLPGGPDKLEKWSGRPRFGRRAHGKQARPDFGLARARPGATLLSSKWKYVSARRNWLKRSMRRRFHVLSTRSIIKSIIAARDIIRRSGSPNIVANKSRPNGKSMQRKTTKTLQIAMLPNHTPKCLVKYVIPNTTM